jgi:hypothetical protein
MVIQAAGMAVPLVAMQVNAGAVEALCTCAGDDHATCPMHHPAPPPRSSENGRALKSTCAPGETALLALFSAPGVLPISTLTTALDAGHDTIVLPAFRTPSHVELPDAPPPRA